MRVAWAGLEEFALGGEEVLDNRAQRQAGQIVQSADQQHSSDQQDDEGEAGDWESPRAGGSDALSAERAGQGHDGNNHQEAANQHRQTDGGVEPGGVGTEAGKSAAVVAIGGAEGVKDFAYAV